MCQTKYLTCPGKQFLPPSFKILSSGSFSPKKQKGHTVKGLLYKVPKCLASHLNLPPPPFKRVWLPPLGSWGEQHSLAGEVVGGPNSEDCTDRHSGTPYRNPKVQPQKQLGADSDRLVTMQILNLKYNKSLQTICKSVEIFQTHASQKFLNFTLFEEGNTFIEPLVSLLSTPE
jgi:hypothetical protein